MLSAPAGRELLSGEPMRPSRSLAPLASLVALGVAALPAAAQQPAATDAGSSAAAWQHLTRAQGELEAAQRALQELLIEDTVQRSSALTGQALAQVRGAI